jgi:hypothetical protein
LALAIDRPLLVFAKKVFILEKLLLERVVSKEKVHLRGCVTGRVTY